MHDSTGSIFVKPPAGSIKPLVAGEVIDVRGKSGPGGFGPVVVEPQIRVIGHSHLPPNPPLETLPHLETGAVDAQWVEVEGTIHSVVESSHSVTLQLAMRDGPVSVTMLRQAGAVYSSLVDAWVRIHANAAPVVNGSNQMIGVHLLAPDLSAVQVLEPAPADPFKTPPTPIDRLLHWGQFSASFHRLHLRGNVTLQWPGSLLCIRDSTGGVCVLTRQDTLLAPGQVVDIAAFAGSQNNEPILTDAVFKSTGLTGAVAAQPVSAGQALLGKHESDLIQVDGQLIGYDLASADATLLLSSGKTIFAAILPKSIAGSEANPWKIGSTLRITGICSVQLDAQSHAREGVAVTNSFRVLMRSPQDVAILESPSWWTPDHALTVLGLAMGATVLVLVWVVALRRRVEQQTNLLREQAELLKESESRYRHMAQHDSLTGLATRLVLQDRLSVALDLARRHRTGLTLLMLDLDRFKEINDTLGHHAGDEVLRVTANRLLDSVRKSDTVARIGGDEFVILLSESADRLSAEIISEKLVAALAVPIPFENQLVPVSASVGVCISWAGELSADELMKIADAALYAAKEHGRNRYEVLCTNAS